MYSQMDWKILVEQQFQQAIQLYDCHETQVYADCCYDLSLLYERVGDGKRLQGRLKWLDWYMSRLERRKGEVTAIKFFVNCTLSTTERRICKLE